MLLASMLFVACKSTAKVQDGANAQNTSAPTIESTEQITSPTHVTLDTAVVDENAVASDNSSLVNQAQGEEIFIGDDAKYLSIESDNYWDDESSYLALDDEYEQIDSSLYEDGFANDGTEQNDEIAEDKSSEIDPYDAYYALRENDYSDDYAKEKIDENLANNVDVASDAITSTKKEESAVTNQVVSNAVSEDANKKDAQNESNKAQSSSTSSALAKNDAKNDGAQKDTSKKTTVSADSFVIDFSSEEYQDYSGYNYGDKDYNKLIATFGPNSFPSDKLMAPGRKSAEQLYNYFVSKNPNGDLARAKRLANLYIEECAIEGVNSDLAFVQMCHETGFLRFGNLVTPDMNNFCGLGSVSKANPGLRFESERMGVRAHVQHLHAYGSTGSLKQTLIDPRYKYVLPRGKAPTLARLTGAWAMDKNYDRKIYSFMKELAYF